MKLQLVILVQLLMLTNGISQTSELGTFCLKYLDIVQEHRIKISREDAFKFIKSVKLSESKGERTNNFGLTYSDLNINNQSKKDEYNRVNTQNITLESYNNYQFLDEIALSIPGHEVAKKCIEALKESGELKKPYLIGQSHSGVLTLTLWPISQSGTQLILEQFEVISPTRTIYKERRNINLASNQSRTKMFKLKKEDCGIINVNYKLSNMQSTFSYSIPSNDFKPIFTNILDKKFEFGNEISRLNTFTSDNDYCVGNILFYLNDDNTRLMAKVTLEIWNPNNINERRSVIAIRKIYSTNENNVLSMDIQKEVPLINGQINDSSNRGIKLDTKNGDNNNFTQVLSTEALNQLGKFKLYVDFHYASVTYEPVPSILNLLQVKIKNRCY